MSEGLHQGRVVLVTRVGAAVGHRDLAAALACAGSDQDRAGLFVELRDGDRETRPALIATASARALEDRLRAHVPAAGIAARGRCCHMTVPADGEGLEQLRSAQPLVRESVCVVAAPPALAAAATALPGLRFSAALLRADLARDRALTALAVRGLMARGQRVTVAKRPLRWPVARLAHFGTLPRGGQDGLPEGAVRRLLSTGTGTGPG